jgi:putative DNA primase/helicase
MTKLDLIVTYFLHLRQPDAPQHIQAREVLDWIREGKFREKVERLRQAPAEQRKALKEALPLVCFSGAFTKRNEAGLEQHSGLVCLDLDKIPESELDDLRAKIQADPFTFALFSSPSGTGLKVLVRIPPDKSQHRQHYEALVRHYASPYLDISGKDPARACFLSWDPELYVNYEALTFTAPPPTPETALSIPEEQLDELTRRALLRAFPRPVQRAKLLDKLLEQVGKVNFRALACFKDEDSKLARKHYVVSVVEEVLEKARENKWDLCKNAAFIYLFNGAYWELLEKEALQTFLGQAAERMGVDRFDARYYAFQMHLCQQFHAVAHLPTPTPSPEVALVNLRNGTFEITAKEQRLRPPLPEDFLTYQLPFDFAPEATAPLFQAYLDRVQPDPDRQRILAECVGYLFVNSSTLKLEKVPLLYGSGANGKSVFFEVVNALLGGPANVSSFTLQQLTDEQGYYRAMIANKLVNYASEINGKMDPAMFKLLASGEPVPARLPYGEPFNVKRYAKLMFNCNELPKEVEQTDAFFRRFLLVPFDVTIPEAEQDKSLAHKIIQGELSGVFNWVLAGLRRLLEQERFTESMAVRNAVEHYRRRSDSVLGFLEETGLRPSTSNHEPLKEIYERYKAHCTESNCRPCGMPTFSERLKHKGFTIDRRSSGRIAWAEVDQEKEVF